MKKPPVPVLLVAVLFIFAGVIGFVYHLKDLNDPNINSGESALILVIRILAIVCGVLLLFRISWSRWLAIAWLLYHVILSIFHNTTELIMHIALLIAISLVLFLPVSRAFFKRNEILKPVQND